jgi:mannose-6-phosphate isomerase-like protein (cupin superfamily)|tara:strand:+ start:240 stop:857 length:618 start_codon:yes stop_codon:yes gene_type:complete
MRKVTFGAGVVLVLAAFVLGRLSAQDSVTGPAPSCTMCLADFVPKEELESYEAISVAQTLTDQQVRSIDLGNANVQVAFARRGNLDMPNPRSVAEHSLVTEVYYVLSGSGTNRLGPDLVDRQQRPDDNRAVQFLNGPGSNSIGIRNPQEVDLEAGDVLVIPAGTGHQFTKINGHISYLMVRVDPDKVVPLMSAADSEAYISENLP